MESILLFVIGIAVLVYSAEKLIGYLVGVASRLDDLALPHRGGLHRDRVRRPRLRHRPEHGGPQRGRPRHGDRHDDRHDRHRARPRRDHRAVPGRRAEGLPGPVRRGPAGDAPVRPHRVPHRRRGGGARRCSSSPSSAGSATASTPRGAPIFRNAEVYEQLEKVGAGGRRPGRRHRRRSTRPPRAAGPAGPGGFDLPPDLRVDQGFLKARRTPPASRWPRRPGPLGLVTGAAVTSEGTGGHPRDLRHRGHPLRRRPSPRWCCRSRTSSSPSSPPAGARRRSGSRNVIGSVVFSVTGKLGIILLAGGASSSTTTCCLAPPGPGRHDGALGVLPRHRPAAPLARLRPAGALRRLLRHQPDGLRRGTGRGRLTSREQ